MPSSPRGWIAWNCYVREYQGRPHSPRLEYEGFSDRRTHDSRESAISVLMLAERASHSACGNGAGLELLMDHFVREASWYSFTGPEQALLRKVERDFRCQLCNADFLAPCGRPRRGCARGRG